MQPNAPAIAPEDLQRFAATLSEGEIDALKYQLSVRAVGLLHHRFDLAPDAPTRASFYEVLRSIHLIQPFRDRVPAYGLAYRGYPAFLSPALLQALQGEAASFRPLAVRNFEQFIYQLDTADSATVGEQLEASAELLAFVRACAGPCAPSYISSYIYYDQAGDCSPPHVDNLFTSLTVMIGLAHQGAGGPRASASVAYWPGCPRLDYALQPGEVAVFYGTCALHGRTPIAAGEVVQSMLLSFRPILAHETN